MPDPLLLILAFFLVLLNGFFVSAEFAIVKLRQTQAEELALARGLRGRVLLSVRQHLDVYLSACQLGITLASLGLGWIGEPAFAALLEPALLTLGVGSPELIQGVAFAAAFSLISFLHIVLGELAPKSLAIRKVAPVALWTAIPLLLFYWTMYPFIRILNGSANWLLRGIGVELASDGDSAHSLGELKKVLVASHHHGDLAKDEAALLTGALELVELSVGDLMRPAAAMSCLDLHEPLSEHLRLIEQTRYSRYPVTEGDRNSVVGVVHVKDLYAALQRKQPFPGLSALLRPPLRVHRDRSAYDLLEQFREGHPHFALVLDNLGNTIGFVTLDHLFEALVGNIRDEFHRTRQDWMEESPGVYAGSGVLPLYQLERMLGVDLVDEGVDSVGGLVMHRLGRVPREGDIVDLGAFSVAVLEMRGAQVQRVRVKRGSGPVRPPEESA